MVYHIYRAILAKYLRDAAHLFNHQNAHLYQPTLQKRNAFSSQRVQIHVCKYTQACMSKQRARARARMCADTCVYMCVCVTKDRKRVACTARIDAHVSACASNGLPPLWNTHLHTTDAITTHTPAIKYHARVCLSYFSP